MGAAFLLLMLSRSIAGLEPGKEREEFETVEEVKSKNLTTSECEEGSDYAWIPTAVLDVAYYLRKFKFNGCDPRYLTEKRTPKKDLYKAFPDPVLKHLHWEVSHNCESSFVECLGYLRDVIAGTELPRHFDSLTVVKRNGWVLPKDAELVRTTDAACLELRDRDEKTFNAFPGVLQKFQWLTSASYYMCWYAMREVSHLRCFEDTCDDFANCIDWNTGPSNGDIRADNSKPFACAVYSFCPDPCCPVRLARTPEDCLKANPCTRHSPKNLTCGFDLRENVDFDSILINWWNVSCICDLEGSRWDSRSGMCVDIDECTECIHTCNPITESCMNLPGSYQCVCNQMGYQEINGSCQPDYVIEEILHPPKVQQQEIHKRMIDRFFDFVYYIKSILTVSSTQRDRSKSSRKSCTGRTRSTNASANWNG